MARDSHVLWASSSEVDSVAHESAREENSDVEGRREASDLRRRGFRKKC